jgi:hypothetical protein
MMRRISGVLGVAALVLAACGEDGASPPAGSGDAGASVHDAATMGTADAAASEARLEVSLDQSSGDLKSDGPLDEALTAMDSAGGTGATDAPATDAGALADARTIEGGAEVGAPDAGADAGPPAHPLCSTADSRGFFGSCSVCVRPDDCDQITVGGRTRSACGCSNVACPCGLRCGCSDIAPGVRVCNICVR